MLLTDETNIRYNNIIFFVIEWEEFVKVFIMGLFLMIITSCSGYFSNKEVSPSGHTAGSLNRLEVIGGGYLSTDNYNEISPFLYRDADTGNAWLFFASDRKGDGLYRIYYAKMASDGRFYPPVEMDSNINASGLSMTYPVVFQGTIYIGYDPTNYNSIYSTNLYISFLCGSNTNCNINTCILDNNMAVLSNVFIFTNNGTNFTGLGFMADPDWGPTLLVFSGSQILSFYFFDGSEGFYSDMDIQTPGQIFNSGSGYIYNDSSYMLLSSGSQIVSGGYIYNYYNYSPPNLPRLLPMI